MGPRHPAESLAERMASVSCLNAVCKEAGALIGSEISSTEGTCQEITEMTETIAGGEEADGSMQDQETEGTLCFAVDTWIGLLLAP